MSFRASQLSFSAVPVTGSAPPKYTLTFTLPTTGKPYKIRIRRQDSPQLRSHDSTLLLSSSNATISFSNLLEEEIEGAWLISFIDSVGDSIVTDTLIIPNSTVTTTTDSGGLDPQPSSVDITLSGENSPYVSKKLKIRGLKMTLETFSLAAKYDPVKIYTIPNGVRAIMLEVNDYVPSSFGEDREDWLLYSFLIDGETYQITPKNRVGDYPQIYHLNSSLAGPLRDVREENGEGFIDSDSGKITQIGVKIELGRPEAQGSATPIVFGYKLKYIVYDDE